MRWRNELCSAWIGSTAARVQGEWFSESDHHGSKCKYRWSARDAWWCFAQTHQRRRGYFQPKRSALHGRCYGWKKCGRERWRFVRCFWKCVLQCGACAQERKAQSDTFRFFVPLWKRRGCRRNSKCVSACLGTNSSGKSECWVGWSARCLSGCTSKNRNFSSEKLFEIVIGNRHSERNGCFHIERFAVRSYFNRRRLEGACALQSRWSNASGWRCGRSASHLRIRQSWIAFAHDAFLEYQGKNGELALSSCRLVGGRRLHWNHEHVAYKEQVRGSVRCGAGCEQRFVVESVEQRFVAHAQHVVVWWNGKHFVEWKASCYWSSIVWNWKGVPQDGKRIQRETQTGVVVVWKGKRWVLEEQWQCIVVGAVESSGRKHFECFGHSASRCDFNSRLSHFRLRHGAFFTEKIVGEVGKSERCYSGNDRCGAGSVLCGIRFRCVREVEGAAAQCLPTVE